MSAAKTRKGDLILIERLDRDYYTDGRGVVERTSYVFGVVASATRDGVAKTCRLVGYGDELVSSGNGEPVFVRTCLGPTGRTSSGSTRDRVAGSCGSTRAVVSGVGGAVSGAGGEDPSLARSPRPAEAIRDPRQSQGRRPAAPDPTRGGRPVTVRGAHGNHGGTR
jgi:hypothetical protein